MEISVSVNQVNDKVGVGMKKGFVFASYVLCFLGETVSLAFVGNLDACNRESGDDIIFAEL